MPSEARKPVYLSYTRLCKAHGVKLHRLKEILAARGYLRDNRPTPLALEEGIARMFPMSETAPYPNADGHYPKWEKSAVAKLIAADEPGADPRLTIHDRRDITRVTKALVTESLAAVGLDATAIYATPEAPAIRGMSPLLFGLSDYATHLSLNIEHRKYGSLSDMLDEVTTWLRSKRKIDKERRDFALKIADVLRAWVAQHT